MPWESVQSFLSCFVSPDRQTDRGVDCSFSWWSARLWLSLQNRLMESLCFWCFSTVNFWTSWLICREFHMKILLPEGMSSDTSNSLTLHVLPAVMASTVLISLAFLILPNKKNESLLYVSKEFSTVCAVLVLPLHCNSCRRFSSEQIRVAYTEF